MNPVSADGEGHLLAIDYNSRVECQVLIGGAVRRQVPVHKIFFNKRVVAMSKSNNKISIKTADESTFEATFSPDLRVPTAVQSINTYPKGTTIGELYDCTHKVHIFKVTLEEKVFET
ncbi:MAG: hypothetical protein J3R72DRAFT_492984 [Linnemannia gamsii]|nr:MAG: hypothetical protein J3R72DRAFT_492984 [Linnemannia gamsii]